VTEDTHLGLDNLQTCLTLNINSKQ
jgi:hypothetical protein